MGLCVLDGGGKNLGCGVLDRTSEKQGMKRFVASPPPKFVHRRGLRGMPTPSYSNPACQSPPQHARSSAFHRDLGLGKAEPARENP